MDPLCGFFAVCTKSSIPFSATFRACQYGFEKLWRKLFSWEKVGTLQMDFGWYLNYVLILWKKQSLT